MGLSMEYGLESTSSWPRRNDPAGSPHPVIVGVVRVNWPSDGGPEPVELLAEAAAAAGRDSGAEQLLKSLDSVRAVRSETRRYPTGGRVLSTVCDMSSGEQVIGAFASAVDVLGSTASEATCVTGRPSGRWMFPLRHGFDSTSENPRSLHVSSAQYKHVVSARQRQISCLSAGHGPERTASIPISGVQAGSPPCL